MTLYLVATPIGNLKDITIRAIETLKNVDIIASEDTRKTGLLLKHLGIKQSQRSYYEFNEDRVAEKLIELLEQGKSVALVTNAGTPCISDPGFPLVHRAIDAGIPVTSIPGPSALISALILSGLPVHSFLFRGFPPHKPGARRKFLENDCRYPYTLIYYESPHRIKGFLKDALAIFGDRQAAITNDLTKMFETVHRATLSELVTSYDQLHVRGEYTVVISGEVGE